MDIVLDIIRSLLDALGSLIMVFADKTEQAQVDADPGLVMFLLLALTIWLGSGCWAGSIAAMRRRSAKLHFLLGLAVPYLYPVAILFMLDIKGAHARGAHQKTAPEPGSDPSAVGSADFDSGAEPPLPEDSATILAQESETVFDRQYFKRIALDEDGNATGPWRIRYNDAEVVARKICDALPHAVVIEAPGIGDKVQRLRIPYDKITACEPAS